MPSNEEALQELTPETDVNCLKQDIDFLVKDGKPDFEEIR